jgi:nitrilase
VLNIATVQAHPLWLDKKATTAKVVGFIEEIAKRGGDVAVFSETFLCGYPYWVCRTNGAAFNDPMQKVAYSAYLDTAVDVTGPEIKEICEAAAEFDVFVFLGASERGPGGASGTVYCSLIAIDPRTGVVGVHRKLQPTHDERLVWGRGDGAGLRAHEFKGVRLGGLNCWENWMPQARHALYADGIDVHISVWPGWSVLTRDITRFISMEGRVYTVAASGLLSLDDIPSDFPMIEEVRAQYENEMFDGGSGMTGPDGEWIVGPCVGKEEILIAEVDPARVRQERLMFDVAGHYSRPDVFEVKVHRGRQKAANFDG